jgi:hypothetical protein
VPIPAVRYIFFWQTGFSKLFFKLLASLSKSKKNTACQKKDAAAIWGLGKLEIIELEISPDRSEKPANKKSLFLYLFESDLRSWKNKLTKTAFFMWTCSEEQDLAPKKMYHYTI